MTLLNWLNSVAVFIEGDLFAWLMVCLFISVCVMMIWSLLFDNKDCDNDARRIKERLEKEHGEDYFDDTLGDMES